MERDFKMEEIKFILKAPLNPILVKRIDDFTIEFGDGSKYASTAKIRDYIACSDGVILRLGAEKELLNTLDYHRNIIKISPKGDFLWRFRPKDHGWGDGFLGLRHGQSAENFSANSGAGFYLEARYSDGEVVLREFVG